MRQIGMSVLLKYLKLHHKSQLLNDTDMVEFGKYFINTYSIRVEKWVYFIENTGINTIMNLEGLHKNIKHSYLDGKWCKSTWLLMLY